MTFNDFAKATFLLPATIFNGMSDLLLGSYKRDRKGEIKKTKGVAETHDGLLGSILEFVKSIAREISNFLYEHRTAIATAFWLSSALAGAAALTVFLWPAALAAVTTFTVAGYSIAGVVGTGLAAQVGAVAALTAAATSAVTYTVAGIANTINFFIKNCCPPNNGGNDDFTSSKDQNSDFKASKAVAGSGKHLAGLGSTQQSDLRSTADDAAAPAHNASPLARPARLTRPTYLEVERSNETTTSLSA